MTAKKVPHVNHQHCSPPPKKFGVAWWAITFGVAAAVMLIAVYACSQAKGADVRVNVHRSMVQVQADQPGAIVRHREVTRDGRRVRTIHRERAYPTKVKHVERRVNVGQIESPRISPTEAGKLSSVIQPAALPEPIDLASLPEPQVRFAAYQTPIVEAAITPKAKKQEAYQKQMLQGLGDINRNLSRPTPAVPPPSTFTPTPAPFVVPPPTDLSPVVQAVQEQGEATRAAVEALGQQLVAKQAEADAPTGLKGKIVAKLEEDAESGGIKGKIAEKLLKWEERGNTLLYVGIAAAIVLLVYWHKNKHGPVAGVMERMGKPELAEREQAIVEKVEARVKGAVATAATANPVLGLAVSEAEKVEQRIKDWVKALNTPAPGQPTGTPPANTPTKSSGT